MMKNILVASAVIASALLSTGCAPKLGGNDYSVKGAGEISQTQKGVIVAARPVMINAQDASQPGAGSVIGGLSGALLGSQIGGGKEGRVVTGVLGGLAGAGAGHLIQGKVTEQEGVEYQVQLDRGDVITLTQGAEPKMSAGQRVLVVQSNRDRSRIVPDLSH
ncbi:glycine zipper 2TM domain-containing protein [Candidatus Finniella inopinata]|uniref:17 kDa surface antigen n=1 Tax=Candidatus Finniella inopinata TaxID=1696036 RepID=A0A4Q7DIF9_9PROT|nr:glycine zipper 2TM domain-containing protein [Candidatus Finniella inopinata]RZI45885.1 glycine zipper 2TM domain-containing protein [Candidatus Finniella inopinata]